MVKIKRLQNSELLNKRAGSFVEQLNKRRGSFVKETGDGF